MARRVASVAALSGWAMFRFQALLKPVLPTELPAGLDRVFFQVWAGLALLVLLRLSPKGLVGAWRSARTRKTTRGSEESE